MPALWEKPGQVPVTAIVFRMLQRRRKQSHVEKFALPDGHLVGIRAGFSSEFPVVKVKLLAWIVAHFAHGAGHLDGHARADCGIALDESLLLWPVPFASCQVGGPFWFCLGEVSRGDEKET